MGGVRRVTRTSYLTVRTAGVSNALPGLVENWTTQETTAYNSALPADSPGAWGGTLTDLDRPFTATGSGHTALGALLTWVYKPDRIAGVQIKVTPTFLTTESPVLELWTLRIATWTKRSRVALTALVRSGESLVLDLTSPVLDADDVDAIWVTLVPTATETLTWTILHCYGVCNTDPVTPACPPNALPSDCDNVTCDVDPTAWECLDFPEDTGGCPEDCGGDEGDPDPLPIPTPTPDPLLLPPIIVPIAMPRYPFKSGGKYLYNCPAPTGIFMKFGTLPGGGSVTVTVLNAHGLRFASAGLAAFSGGPEVTSQTIAAAGDMEWRVTNNSGYDAHGNGVVLNYLLPSQDIPELTFLFTRQLAGSAWHVAGNLLDILMYFWTYEIAFAEPC